MNKLADSPAFPISSKCEGYGGMTLRQYYAGLALQGLLASDAPLSVDGKRAESADQFAIAAVEQADALLAELAKTTSQSC